jgi:hypothetical protein
LVCGNLLHSDRDTHAHFVSASPLPCGLSRIKTGLFAVGRKQVGGPVTGTRT